MKFTQHYSSSTSNLYTVEAANGKRLMIECGATWKQILNAMDYRLDNVVGCLLTHSHNDHSKSVLDVVKNSIRTYMEFETFALMPKLALNMVSFELTENGHKMDLYDGFGFYAFRVNHDVPAVGYIIEYHIDRPRVNEYMLFVTDTSHITQRFNVPFSIIAIECSYDREILQNRVDDNTIDENLAKRLLTSHMEKQTTIKYLSECCDLSKCKEIHLLHMSRDNIDAEATRKEIEERVFIKTITV